MRHRTHETATFYAALGRVRRATQEKLDYTHRLQTLFYFFGLHLFQKKFTMPHITAGKDLHSVLDEAYIFAALLILSMYLGYAKLYYKYGSYSLEARDYFAMSFLFLIGASIDVQCA